MKVVEPQTNSAGKSEGDERVAAHLVSAAHFMDELADTFRLIASNPVGPQQLYDLVRATHTGMDSLRGVDVVVGAELDRRSTSDGTTIRSRDAFRSFGRVSDADAKRAAGRSALTEFMPQVGEAAIAGRARAENLDTLAAARRKWRNKPEWLKQLDGMDQLLSYKVQDETPERFRKWLKRTMDEISDNGSTEERSEREKSEVKVWIGRDGRTKFRGDLDAEWGEQFRTAANDQIASLAARKAKAGIPFKRDDNLRAEAFVELMTGAQAAHGRPTINLIYDAETMQSGPHEDSIRETFGGQDLTDEALQRHLCDSDVRKILLGNNGVPLAVGRKERTATDAQRAALRTMYATCAWCEVPFENCQIHHLTPWTEGGKTDLDELIPLCSDHHHHVHDLDWVLKLQLPDRSLEIYQPDGTHWLTKPCPATEPAAKRVAARRERRVGGKEPDRSPPDNRTKREAPIPDPKNTSSPPDESIVRRAA